MILANYRLNKQYIASAFCENKKKPQMRCEGKCHLKKQLDAEDKKESSLPNQNAKEKNEIQFCSHEEPFHIPNFLTNTYKYLPFSFSLTVVDQKAVFHPPCC